MRNWLIGLYVLEYEQQGKDRVQYGGKLLVSIAQVLKQKGMKGLAERNLTHCILYFLNYFLCSFF